MARIIHDSNIGKSIARMRRSAGGFTLLEVLFCLAIIGGSFLLLLLDRLTVTDHMQEAIRTRQIQRLAHEKLQEFIHGTEESSQGTFPGEPRMDWQVEVNNVSSSEAASTEISFVECRITVKYKDELDQDQQYDLSTWILPGKDDPILDELPVTTDTTDTTGAAGATGGGH